MPAYRRTVAWVNMDGELQEGRIAGVGAASYIVHSGNRYFAVPIAECKLLTRVKTSYAVLAETKRQLVRLAHLYGSESLAMAVAVDRLYKEKQDELLP